MTTSRIGGARSTGHEDEECEEADVDRDVRYCTLTSDLWPGLLALRLRSFDEQHGLLESTVLRGAARILFES
jgi:hypothetical protein